MAGLVELFILVALLYWLFYPRAHKMVDILSTRLQDIYSKWGSSTEMNKGVFHNEAKHLSYAGLRRYGYQERQRKRALAREASRESDLLEIKEEPWQLGIKKEIRPFMGLCCNNCTSTSRNSTLASHACQEQWTRNILLVDSQGYENGYLARTFCHLNTVLKIKKYDYPQLAPTVLRDERLQQAIEAATQHEFEPLKEKNEKQYAFLIKKHETRATKLLYDMRSTLSDFLLRVTSWLLYKLLPCFLTSVVVHPGQVKMLNKASATGLPLIFLPLHRSHLDYILISFILLNNNIRSPLVAAGDNLRIPVFGWLLRGLGAFFIKRRIDPVQGKRDIVYRAVLHTYMMECLRAGHNLEFFIEGGRSRTGKACMPKGGLLSVIVDAYMDGTIEDALLVPVSVNYEKLVDGNFVREQLGQPKQMETFGKAIKSIWSVLNSNYGMMRIDFNQPFSLKELVRSFHKVKVRSAAPDTGGGGDNRDSPPLSPSHHSVTNGERPRKPLHSVPSSSSLYGTDIVEEEHRHLVESIARHIVYDCVASTAIMSTNALAFLLLNQFRSGVSMEKLVGAMEKLKKDLISSGRDVGFSGETIDVINHACELLGPGLVRRERVKREGDGGSETTIMVRPFTMIPNVIELSYYSNAVLSQFVMESVVVTAIYSLLAMDTDKPEMEGSYRRLGFSEEQIVHYAHDLCEILQFEFIFSKPCQQLDTTIREGIAHFKWRDILITNAIEHTEQEWCSRLAKNLEEIAEDDSKSWETKEQLFLDTREEAVQTLEFYHSLLKSLIDVYAVSALGLQRIVSRQLTEQEYIQELLLEMKSQLNMGFAQYEESLSVDPFKNSLKLFEKWEVLECHTHQRVKLYYLKDYYDSEETVRTVFDKVKRFKWMPASINGIVSS